MPAQRASAIYHKGWQVAVVRQVAPSAGGRLRVDGELAVAHQGGLVPLVWLAESSRLPGTDTTPPTLSTRLRSHSMADRRKTLYTRYFRGPGGAIFFILFQSISHVRRVSLEFGSRFVGIKMMSVRQSRDMSGSPSVTIKHSIQLTRETSRQPSSGNMRAVTCTTYQRECECGDLYHLPAGM